MTLFKKNMTDYARNIGKELQSLKPNHSNLSLLSDNYRKKILRQYYNIVYLPHCGHNVYNDFNEIQNHILTCKTTSRKEKAGLVKFVPNTWRGEQRV